MTREGPIPFRDRLFKGRLCRHEKQRLRPRSEGMERAFFYDQFGSQGRTAGAGGSTYGPEKMLEGRRRRDWSPGCAKGPL